MNSYSCFPVATIVLLLTGCAGYNHTLFMTKSNVGLDFDAKPPTAEITVSRKEAVIAPSFEKGQTPPVMASFKPHAGVNGGFKNFFVGVDQTFAGGDAAMNMAKFYSKPTPGDGVPDFSSTLVLSKKPTSRTIFTKIPDAGKVRPFIFGTDTMLGLKVAWTGVGGQFPDTVKAGFNRKEFAWAPLTMTNVPGTTQYHVNMPSFLATIDSDETADTEAAGISALQYFSTGGAATALARQRDVRLAMLARLDPNTKEFKALGANLSPEGRATAFVLLRPIYAELLRIRNTNPSADTHVRALDSLLPPNLERDYDEYEYDAGTRNLTRLSPRRALTGDGFHRVLNYETGLADSIEHLTSGLADAQLRIEGTAATEEARTKLAETLRDYIRKQERFRQNIEAESAKVREAIDFFFY